MMCFPKPPMEKDWERSRRNEQSRNAYRCAGLDKELAHGGAVVHGVEGGDLVDSHGGHLEQAGDLVHDADAGEAVLALAEVEQGHDGGLFVLSRVALEDLGDELLILGVELERQVGVVVGCVSVLERSEVSELPERFCISMGDPRLSLSFNGGMQRNWDGEAAAKRLRFLGRARLYHLEGVAGPAGCDGKGAGLRAGDA